MKKRIADIDPFAELVGGTTDTIDVTCVTDTTNTTNTTCVSNVSCVSDTTDTTNTTNTSYTRFNFVITSDNAAFLKAISKLTGQSAARYINSLLDERRNGADGETVRQFNKFMKGKE